MKLIKNIIFDIGNVLLHFKPKEFLQQKGLETIKISEVHQEIYLSNEWEMLDRGVITEETAKKILIGRSKHNGELIKLAFENWYEMFTPIENSISILRDTLLLLILFS